MVTLLEMLAGWLLGCAGLVLLTWAIAESFGTGAISRQARKDGHDRKALN
jgi:hypothetical protein